MREHGLKSQEKGFHNMFPEDNEPTEYDASQLLNDYFNADRDFFGQAVLEGQDQVWGTDASETLTGTAANETFDGNVTPGATAGDTLVGGDGDDTYFISDDMTTITEDAGEGTMDTVVTDQDFDLADHTNSTGGASEIEEVELWYASDIDVDMSLATWDTEITGNDGANVITGGSGVDDIFAGAGDDTITTGAGDDLIDDQDGNDIVNAGAGADKIYNGAGDDTITGGSGSDEFHFYHVEGVQADVITDFEAGVDKLHITDMDMWNFSLTSTPTGTLFTYGTDRSIFVEGDGDGDFLMSDVTFHTSDPGGSPF